MFYKFDIYDNDFIQEGDLIEFETDGKPHAFGSQLDYVAQVRANPAFLANLSIFHGGTIIVYDGQYDNQKEDPKIKEFRDRITKIYRKNKKGNYTCIFVKVKG